MTDGHKSVGGGNPYVYLANNGPATREEMPHGPSRYDRDSGVRKFSLGSSYRGAVMQGGGNKTAVYYIEGKHQPRSVVKRWVEANPTTVERVSGWALHHRAPEEFRDALRDIVGIDRDFHGGDRTTERECPFCGDGIKRYPDHLPDCEEKP